MTGSLIEAQGTANVNVTVHGTVFTVARGDLFQFTAPGSGTSDLVFTGNTLSNNHVGHRHRRRRRDHRQRRHRRTSPSTSSDNTFRDAVGHAVLIVKESAPAR